MIEDFDTFVFCQNVCTYHNRYDGWCHHNNCDVSEVEYCEYYNRIAKKLRIDIFS